MQAAPLRHAWDRARKDFMVEFFRRLFAPYNLYCMSVCGAFLAVWFYFSREHETPTANPLGRQRPPRQGPSIDESL